MMESEYIIIGGGVVGFSIAWGLLQRGKRVIILDAGDATHRASRGNFGLVWVQSKGLDCPDYARWTQRSVGMWSQLAGELKQNTGHDLCLEQNGGYDFHFTTQSLEDRLDQYESLKQELDGHYPFEVLDHAALKREEPNIGKGVTAILHQQDGHVNPLRLLKALAQDIGQLGGQIRTGAEVIDTSFDKGSGFCLSCQQGNKYRSAKVIVCAGLGANDLAPGLGFKVRVHPQRGQVLITEKLPRLMNRPSGIIRQVDEGGVQIGDSKENVGFDDSVTLDVAAALAARAIKVYPDLACAKLVRSWAALRVMSPDGLPVYQQSTRMPGAFLITCHSGITLAAAHAYFLADWLEQTESAPDLEVFGEQRFIL